MEPGRLVASSLVADSWVLANLLCGRVGGHWAADGVGGDRGGDVGAGGDWCVAEQDWSVANDGRCVQDRGRKWGAQQGSVERWGEQCWCGGRQEWCSWGQDGAGAGT